jgi:hypothetical protein
LLLASAALLSLLPGCSEKRVEVFPVQGKITFEGKPPVGAQVVLHPQGDLTFNNIAPLGIVKDDGSFKISVYGDGDGAPAGDYVATVQWFKVTAQDGGAGKGPNVIPKQYADPDTSPIKLTVKGGTTNELEPIQIAAH